MTVLLISVGIAAAVVVGASAGHLVRKRHDVAALYDLRRYQISPALPARPITAIAERLDRV